MFAAATAKGGDGFDLLVRKQGAFPVDGIVAGDLPVIGIDFAGDEFFAEAGDGGNEGGVASTGDGVGSEGDACEFGVDHFLDDDGGW